MRPRWTSGCTPEVRLVAAHLFGWRVRRRFSAMGASEICRWGIDEPYEF
jgi:hypothetical protein